jgi:hypothetical protein
MRTQFTLAVLLVGALAGCQKKPGAEPPTQPSTNAEAPSLPAARSASRSGPPPGAKPLPPPPAVVAARADNYVRQNVEGQVDGFLTEQLRTFIQQKQRFPESFVEFAAARLDSVPRPPEGKRWVIDAATVQVKSVTAQ